MHCLATDFLYLHAFARRGLHTRLSFPSTVASIHVYGAVAWQCIDPIDNSIVACVFRGFCDSAVLDWSKYATICIIGN
jgi:hypothetical protein